MEDKLRLNTKLYSFEGIIGRRDFFLNWVYISALSLLVTLPIMDWLYTNSETFLDFFAFAKVFSNAPSWLKAWVFLGITGVCILSLSNIFRRLNDICGEINKNLQITFSVFFVLSSFWIFTPTGFSILMFFISKIMLIYLLFKKGRITSKYPYDFRKEFNWGAFLGTWIWGLFNKSYLPMWQLVIAFTPWHLHYALYCGLKGNEWAFINKKCTDINDFNSSQKQQSVIFAVLIFLISPLLYFVLILGIALILTSSIENISKDPAKVQKLETNVSKMVESFSNMYFESYEITESENKFYLKGADWNRYSFKEKKDIIEFAANIAAEKRREKKSSKNSRHSKITELPRTKIYSQESGKLLGEFIIDKTLLESKSPTAKEVFQSVFKSYRFYKAS